MTKREIGERSLGELSFLVMAEHGLERWDLDRILNGMGARRISTAANGADAVDRLKEAREPFDVILWDLDATTSQGVESLQRLLGREPAPSFIFVTALDASAVAPYESTQRALGVNVIGVLQKPVTAGKLASLVELHRARAAKRDAQPSKRK